MSSEIRRMKTNFPPINHVDWSLVDPVAAMALYERVSAKCSMPHFGPWHPYAVLEYNGYVLPMRKEPQ